MTLKDLKELINNQTAYKDGIIFEGDLFIAKQYIEAIAKINQKPISYTQNIQEVKKVRSLFGEIETPKSLVYVTDKLTSLIEIKPYCYIICKSYVGNNKIDITKLQEWHVIDYLTSNSKVDPIKLKALAKACNYDLFLLDNELSKFKIFNTSVQSSVYNRLYEDGQLTKSYEETIFDFTNALLNKDKNLLIKFYTNLSNYDVEPLGVVTIIYKQLRNIILVGFNKNATEENTGLSSKQIYYIKKNLNKFDSNYIIKSFQFICEVEKLLKEGVITNNQLLDYVVINLL